ncbi:hypothetical protein AZE42_09007, partial [Rhizopogon vesiculosus]
MAPELFKYIFANLLPEVIVHSQSQAEEQIRDHYHLQVHCIHSVFVGGDGFYEWFLGPRMIYTSGVILDAEKHASLEELQDNILRFVCSKLNFKPEDRLLDVGCGWGTLATYAAKNYDCDVTSITLGKNQTKFGNERIKFNGVTPDKARILCMDYREIPGGP